MGHNDRHGGVALRKESVDRNYENMQTPMKDVVALRKESVDRNVSDKAIPGCNDVALRKESVDRNFIIDTQRPERRLSLSARRAWIEMIKRKKQY